MDALKKILLVCLVMAILGTGAGIFIALKIVQRYSPSEPGWQTTMRVVVDPRSVFPDKNDIEILILGTDFNYTQKDIVYTKNVRSDTMILAHLNLKDKVIKLLSIPRDTRAYIPGDCYQGSCYDKINAAFAVGGAKLSETVVANLTGIPIDYYVRIKEQGLKNLVDAIGGIDLNAEENMDYDDSWGHLHIHLKKGWQHMDGEKAAGYARFRHDPEGDYGRIRRQQQVIQAIAKRMMEPGQLANLDDIAKVARENVETNLYFPQVLALGNLFKGIHLSGLKAVTLPTTPQDFLEGGYWVSYVVMQDAEARKVLQDFISDETASSPAVPALSVEVLNGSGIPGKAQVVADKLRSGGFVVFRVANADRFDYAKTEIVDHTGQGEGLLVAKLFGPGETETYSKPQDPRQVDVTVIVGRDQ